MEGIGGMCNEFLQYTRLEVGNGAMIKFWTDFLILEADLEEVIQT